MRDLGLSTTDLKLFSMSQFFHNVFQALSPIGITGLGGSRTNSVIAYARLTPPPAAPPQPFLASNALLVVWGWYHERVLDALQKQHTHRECKDISSLILFCTLFLDFLSVIFALAVATFNAMKMILNICSRFVVYTLFSVALIICSKPVSFIKREIRTVKFPCSKTEDTLSFYSLCLWQEESYGTDDLHCTYQVFQSFLYW